MYGASFSFPDSRGAAASAGRASDLHLVATGPAWLRSTFGGFTRMSHENHRTVVGWLLICLLTVYGGGYALLRFTGKAVVFHYASGSRELWSNIDRMPVVGSALQAAYLPLIRSECALRHLEWSP